MTGPAPRPPGLIAYDWDGNPISMEDWAMLRQLNVHVAETWVGPFRVSTVWLGLDHAFGYGGAPIIFETMVFDSGENPREDLLCDRYATHDEAKAGHQAAVAYVEDMSRPGAIETPDKIESTTDD